MGVGIDIAEIGSQFDKLINKLKAIENGIGTQQLARAVQRTAHLGLEVVSDEIHKVREHSGKHRIVPEDVVTDLIDSGNYLNTWVVSQTGPLSAKISTNCEYALALEYGKHGPELVHPYSYVNKNGTTVNVKAHVRDINMKGFFIGHLAAVKIRKLFRQELTDALKRAVEGKA